MRSAIRKIKPSKGVSHGVYIVLNVLLPVLLYVFVRADLATIAIALLLISKWRMFAVRPRFWWPNVRTNAVDIIVGLAAIAAMNAGRFGYIGLAVVVVWAGWLLYIKPRSSVFWVSAQAFVGMVTGLLTVFAVASGGALWLLVAAVAAVCFFTAHHFLYAFEEQYLRLLAYTWAYFSAALMWILGHWLIFYGPIAQPALILVTLGFGIGTLYYLDHFERLSALVRRQIIFIMAATIICILVFSDWGDKVV
ncbi:MAG: hypothetical protein QG629_856 [Patescibacteria group bacterium]|nr:hypothetical protein [Candidatus Saccharibacteria bacterium]MDQ5963773.1 hypothetical protein [Patescibacteria group bacterium]